MRQHHRGSQHEVIDREGLVAPVEKRLQLSITVDGDQIRFCPEKQHIGDRSNNQENALWGVNIQFTCYFGVRQGAYEVDPALPQSIRSLPPLPQPATRGPGPKVTVSW